MQLLEIRTEIRNRLGEDVQDYWLDSQINRAINTAIREFSHEERWPWLYTEKTDGTLGVGATDYLLPDDIDFTRSFNFGLKTAALVHVTPEPRRVSPVEGFKLRRRFTSNAQPRYFYLVKATSTTNVLAYTIRFAPAADQAYTLDFQYLRRPPALASDTVEPDLPEDYHEAVVAHATANLWLPELQGSQVKAAEQFELYAAVLSKARSELKKFAEDEEVVWGREQDEEDRRGFGPRMPDTYGDAWTF